jgi:anionic cell wall polymer biosynthesis LytR-Cps2A-Psr (LCP) family protein
VRSRQATGDEGTDFARAKRQQQVIAALKDKILAPSFWKDSKTIKEFTQVINEMVETDMNWSEKISLAKLFLDLRNKEIRHLILDAGDTLLNSTGKRKGFLINPPEWEYDGQWVLVPRSGNFDEIHKYIDCQLKDSNCSIQP